MEGREEKKTEKVERRKEKKKGRRKIEGREGDKRGEAGRQPLVHFRGDGCWSDNGRDLILPCQGTLVSAVLKHPLDNSKGEVHALCHCHSGVPLSL